LLFLPKHDHVTFGCLLSQIRLSSSVASLSVKLVHPTQPVEHLGNIYMLFCTSAIRWPPCEILWRSSQGYPPSGVKRKRDSQISYCTIQWYNIRPSRVSHNKGCGPQFGETLYIFEVNRARKVKAIAQEDMNKISDPEHNFREWLEWQCPDSFETSVLYKSYTYLLKFFSNFSNCPKRVELGSSYSGCKLIIKYGK